MSREELILRPDGVRTEGDTLVVEIRMPWYRSLPLSSVSSVEVAVDGVAADSDEIVFELEGRRYSLQELRERWETVWFVQDAALLRVPGLNVRAGETHEVTAGVGLRLPYIIIDGIGPLERYNEITRNVVVGEGDA